MEHIDIVKPGNPADDAGHVKMAFADLVTRIAAQPITLTSLTDVTFDVGKHTNGFEQYEMGLDPIHGRALHTRKVKSQIRKASPGSPKDCILFDTYANCAGGMIVVGP
jgi:hypothetical protein